MRAAHVYSEPVEVVGLDVYGTVLCTNDAENICPPRKGIEVFFDRCKSEGVYIVTASDAKPEDLKRNMAETFERHGLMRLLATILGFYHLDQSPHKDYTQVLIDFGIAAQPSRLLVIGDSYKDERGAAVCGARFIKVPEYENVGDWGTFDFAQINPRTGDHQQE